jgi:hypothetical protein
MRQLSIVLAVLYILLYQNIGISQPLPPNAKNVDRTAVSFYDGLQTFRALEYTMNPDPQSQKIYRLQTLPENGFPAIGLQGVDGGQSVHFEDKMPLDNQFTDNQTQYLSAEAVQTFYAFQRVMETFDQRFGWKGIDGIGMAPIKIYLKNSDDNPVEPDTYSNFYKDDFEEHFEFIRSLSDNKSLLNAIDDIAHEYTHAIFHYKTSIVNYEPYQCNEYRTINEGIASIFGIYIKNKLKQSSPQNYDWVVGTQSSNTPRPLNNPKSGQYADTYGGEYYVNECTENYKPHPGGGIAEKWFYLLSAGFQGSAYNDLGYGYSNLTGIGVEKAIQVLWDAIPTIKVYSDYPALRVLTLQAAEKLYGLHSTEYIAVQNAWCAVGVCDNNPVGFSMYPANATGSVNPWPAVNVNLTWQNNLVQEWKVEMSTKYDFSENLQTVTVDNFTTIVDQNGLLVNYAAFDGYYHPGEKVYARAKITKADPNFCKGLNPLCAFYQQFGPTHAFMLKDQKIKFWPDNSLSEIVNPWDKPDLRWKSIVDAARYRIQVATDNAFNNLIYDGIALHTGNFTETGEINAVLEAGHDYYTRVRAERLDFIKINKNYGAWSDVINLHATTPQTSIIQALNQNANDPAKVVPSLGFWVTWYAYPGVTNYVIQVAKDAAFTNIVRSQIVPANINAIEFLLPSLPDQTELFVQVLPQKGAAFGICNKVWRVKTNEASMAPVMKGPSNGSSFPFRNFLSVFEWKGGTLNMNMVDHFEIRVTEKTFGLTSIFSTQGKAFDFALLDPFMFDDKMGIEVKVLAVGPYGAKSAPSAPFNYNICPDHPEIIFPADQISKADAFLDFDIQWHDSFWFDPGSEYLVTIRDAMTGIPVPGFDNKPITTTSMSVPAGTLTNGKNYSVAVKNSSSCPGIILTENLFSVGAGGSNQPQPPKLVNFNIELKGFRNDLDGIAWETSDYLLGIELIDPDGNPLALVDPNLNQVTELLVDSENSGVIMVGNNKPEGKYKLRLKMLNIFDPLLYYPFDQPRFSVFLNGKPEINPHIITANFLDPASPSHEWNIGFQFTDIVLDVK